MLKDGLLICLKDETDARIEDYKINPRSIQSPSAYGSYLTNDGTVFEIPLDLLEDFFIWLKQSNKENICRKKVLKGLSTAQIFDFVTFLLFLRERAIDWEELPDVASKFSSKPKLSQLIEAYIRELERIPYIPPSMIPIKDIFDISYIYKQI